MTYYQQILDDLQRDQPPCPSVIPSFYLDSDPPVQQIRCLKKQYRRAKSLGNRKELLYVLWYIGELIETKVDGLDRALCLNELSYHYYKLVKKVYYLYEFLGVEQIGRTQTTTITQIAKLTRSQHRNLVEEAITLAGARL